MAGNLVDLQTQVVICVIPVQLGTFCSITKIPDLICRKESFDRIVEVGNIAEK